MRQLISIEFCERDSRERIGSYFFLPHSCRKNSAFDLTRKVHLMRPIERTAFHRASSNGARGMNPPKDDSPRSGSTGINKFNRVLLAAVER